MSEEYKLYLAMLFSGLVFSTFVVGTAVYEKKLKHIERMHGCDISKAEPELIID